MPMGVFVGPATGKELKQIISFSERMGPLEAFGVHPPSLEEAFKSNSRVLVLKAPGTERGEHEIIGFGFLRLNTAEEVELRKIGLLRRFRGHHGKHFLGLLEDFAVSEFGAKKIVLNVSQTFWKERGPQKFLPGDVRQRWFRARGYAANPKQDGLLKHLIK